jgi:uncharacterized integral membrane protein
MKKAKIIAIVVILLLVLIVFLQNTQAVETKFLFMTVTMPRLLLLFVTFILGFVGGLITASYIIRKPVKNSIPGSFRAVFYD